MAEVKGSSPFETTGDCSLMAKRRVVVSEVAGSSPVYHPCFFRKWLIEIFWLGADIVQW